MKCNIFIETYQSLYIVKKEKKKDPSQLCQQIWCSTGVHSQPFIILSHDLCCRERPFHGSIFVTLQHRCQTEVILFDVIIFIFVI